MLNKAIRIGLVDDHQMTRSGLLHLIEHQPEMEVVVEAGHISEALEQIKERAPDLVLLDLHVPACDRLTAVRQIREACPGIKVIILTSDRDPIMVEKALESGVTGYVLKENAFEEVTRAMRVVMEGKLYLCPETTTTVVRNRQTSGTPDVVPLLSDREKLLLRLVGGGVRNKEIAAQLKVTPKSVETYRARLMKKLKCASTAEVIHYAIREGVVTA